MRRRLLLSMSSVALGVAALVAIDSFAANVVASVRESSRAILGGDLALTARAPLSGTAATLVDSLVRSGADTAQVTTFVSMASARRGSGTRLTQVRAVTARYPLAGVVATDPASVWRTLQTAPRAIVDRSLLATLDARVGDTLTIGASAFTIAGTIRSVPGDASIAASIGPRVFIAAKYVPGTQLLVFGSRAEYRTLVALPHGARAPDRAWLVRTRPELEAQGVRIQTAADAEVNLTNSVQRLTDFVGIVGLAALLLGGIGVASGVTAFVTRKIDAVAILRCVGATGAQVLAIYISQAAAMGLIGAAVGAMLGVVIQYVLPTVARDLLPVDVTIQLVPRAVGLGLALGLWVAVLCALRPLLALRHVSPLQALRRDTDAAALDRGRREPGALVALGALVATIVAAAVSRSGAWRQGLATSVGIALVLAALWLGAAALSAAARRIVGARWPYTARQGIANLYRPANQTRAVIIALGFGAFLVSTLYLVQSSLLSQFSATIAGSRANLLFFDVQEDEAAPLDTLIRTGGGETIERAPMVTMRIADINGISAAALAASRRVADVGTSGASSRNRGGDAGRSGRASTRSGWAVRHEYRSTYRDTLVSSEHVVAGRWFSAPAGSDTIARVSLEDGVAKELGVGVGDRVTWDVQGVRVPSRVTSLRHVDWARFEPNFFAVFQSGTLEAAPKQYIILAHADSAASLAQLERGVIDRYPNISSVDLSVIREAVNGVLRKVSLAIRFLAAFSLVMGLPVLFSAVAAGRRARVREGVLLKILGASRSQVGRIMLAEYATLGILGSAAGVILSAAAAWALVHFVFDSSFTLSIAPALTVAGITAALTALIGLLGSRDVFAETPIAALRDA
jgi:putative ABC transport system permease protein